MAFLCVLVLLSISSVTSPDSQTIQKQVTFEGTLKKHRKWLFEYSIESPSSGHSFALRTCDSLEEIEPGSTIRVQGHLGTKYHQGGTKLDKSPFPAQWVVYMDVNEIVVLKSSKENLQQQVASKSWSYRIPTVQLDPFASYLTGDISGKYLKEIVNQKDITEVIVLANNTSAPIGMHVSTIGSILKKNPKIESLYETDPDSGIRRRLDIFQRGFFTALLKTKDDEYVGFQLDRDKARIFTKKGDGWVVR